MGNKRQKNSSSGSGKSVPNKADLPPVGVPVWVRCDGFRTMAYLDELGVWRTLADRKELKGVIGIFMTEDE